MENEENKSVNIETQKEAAVKEDTSTPDVKHKTFTQEEVNSLVSERVKRAKESAIKEVLKETGFDSKDNLKSYLETSKEELSNYKFTDACNENKISAERFDDVKALLKGKGLEVNEENIAEVAKTHPEWRREKRKPALEPIDIGSNTKSMGDSEESLKKMARGWFPSLN